MSASKRTASRRLPVKMKAGKQTPGAVVEWVVVVVLASFSAEGEAGKALELIHDCGVVVVMTA